MNKPAVLQPRAVGTPHAFSDIDLAVVSPDFNDKPISFKADIAAQVKLHCPREVGIHPVAQQNFGNARPTSFLGHILSTGTIVCKNGSFHLK